MKITQVNNDQLDISESGVSNIVGGIVAMIIGVAAGAAPIVNGELPWWVSLIGGLMFLLGAFMLKSASSSLIALRRGGDSEVTIKRLIGGATTHTTFKSSSVTSVRLETYTDYSKSGSSNERNTPQRERVSRLLLAMQDGSELEVGSKRVTSGPGISVIGLSTGSLVAAPLSKEASQIAAFLGVQLDASQRGEMGMLEVAQAAQTLLTNQSASGQTGSVAQSPVNATPTVVAEAVAPTIPATTPVAPVMPVAPVVPVAPASPVAPVVPAATLTPAAPVSPAPAPQPSTPEKPLGQ